MAAKKNTESRTSKNWTFTVNNFTPMDEIFFKETPWTYMVYGRENLTEGTPHLQGFLVTKVSRLSAMKLLHPTAHWEIAKGSAEQNRVYCTKDGDYVEQGLIPASASARAKKGGEAEIERWETALTAMKEGRLDDVPADIMIRHYGNVQKIKAAHQAAPVALEGELKNQWIWGAPGCGKTSKVFKEHTSLYLKGLHKWWDGYDGQETVLIDDMDPYHKSLAQQFKEWAHHYPFPAECKGGSMCIRPKLIIVTSNYRIDEVWEDPITREAMHRRFTEVYVPSNKTITDSLTVV